MFAISRAAKRLGERPEKGERFPRVQARPLDVVGLLHRLERELRAFGVDGQLRLLLGFSAAGFFAVGFVLARGYCRRRAPGARAARARLAGVVRRTGEFVGAGDFRGALGRGRIGGRRQRGRTSRAGSADTTAKASGRTRRRESGDARAGSGDRLQKH